MPAASSGAKAASRSAVAAPAGPEPTMTASRRSTNALLAPRDGPRHCPRPCPLTAPVAAGGGPSSLTYLPCPGPDGRGLMPPATPCFRLFDAAPAPGAPPPTTAEALGPSARSNQRTVRAVHEVQHPRHAGTRRPDARVAGSDSLGAGCHLRSVTNDRD